MQKPIIFFHVKLKSVFWKARFVW